MADAKWSSNTDFAPQPTILGTDRVMGLRSGANIKSLGILAGTDQVTGLDAALAAKMDQVLTTKGDLVGFSTEPVRVAVGTDGQVPTADSKEAAGWKWADNGSGSGDVTGPASSTDGGFAVYNGTSGKVIKNNAMKPMLLPFTYNNFGVQVDGTNNGTVCVPPSNNLVFSVDANRDLATNDAFCYLNAANSDAVTFTIRAQADVPFPLGGWTDIISSSGAAITIAPASGVTFRAPGNLLTTNGLYTGFRMRRIGGDVWDIMPFGYQTPLPSNAKLGCAAATVGNLNATYDNGVDGVGASLTNAGFQEAFSADGALLVAGRRVLVWQQTNPFENGIYVVSFAGDSSNNWTITRADDFNSSNNISINSYTCIAGGTQNMGKTFCLATGDPYVIGTTNLVFGYPTGGVSFVESSGYISLRWTDFATSSAQTSAIMGTFTETTTSATLKNNTTNYANNASQVVYTLPATSPKGSRLKIRWQGAGGWKVAQNAGQSIRLGSKVSITGTSGFINSTASGDCVELETLVADTVFMVVNTVGNIWVEE